MATANKTPPMIAPGVLCPKCKGAMTDERANKRTAKSPDYQCANVLCTDASGKYRTGVWVEKGNGSGAETSASAGGNAGNSTSAAPAEPASSDDRDKALLAQRAVYATRMKQSVAYVLENIEPLYKAKGIGMTDDGVYKHAYSIWQEWCERGIIQ